MQASLSGWHSGFIFLLRLRSAGGPISSKHHRVSTEGIRRVFEESGPQGYTKELQLPDTVKLFVKTIIPIERAFICMDSVDVLLPEKRAKLLDALDQISREVPNTRIFFTAMPHIRPEIETDFKDRPDNKRIELDPPDSIGRHVSWKIYENTLLQIDYG